MKGSLRTKLRHETRKIEYNVQTSTRRHYRMAVRVLVLLFFVGYVMTTFLIRSASALERPYVAEVSGPVVSITSLVPDESEQTTDLSNVTPSPAASEQPAAQSTPEVTAQPTAEPSAQPTEEPTATPTPEPTTTPEATPELDAAEFTGEHGGVQIRLLTARDERTETSFTLSLSRITAESNADAFERYQALLSELVTADQLDDCIVYELHYLADGVAIDPPQGSAKIELSDAANLSALNADSIRAFYLLGSADSTTAEIHSATVQSNDGIIAFSSAACPSAIVIYGQASVAEPSANEATPDPNSTTTPAEETPEPSPSIEPTPLYEYENGGLYVSGSPASSDVLPEGATLSAERITSENYPERYAKYADMLQQLYDTEFPIAFYAYDISFHADGQEVEPVGDVVDVTIRDDAFVQDVEKPLVYHVVNEQSADPALQEVPALAETSDGEAQVAFSADSFSTYIVLANGTTLTLADNSGLTYKIIATAADKFTNTSYYNSSRALGIAGNFHIVAFDTATLSAHTNGNVLANKVVANSNFGTNGLASELSYIQNYTQVNGVSASDNAHVLVLGNANTITALDNGNAFGINAVKLDRPKNLWQDKATATVPFIDLVALKTSVKSLSSSLAGNSAAYTTSHLSTTGGSCDLSYVTLTNPDKVGYFNITAAALATYNYFGVQGFQSGHNGAVIINVDCTGVSGTITLPECRMYVNGTALNFAEVTNFVNGRILWNLVNCTATVTTKLLYASLLAPDATINVAQNMNGTVIGNKVTITAESHRDDFLGSLSNGVTVTANKVWSDYASGSPANTSVTLQLYRSTDGGVSKTAYSTPVTLNTASGWSYSWTELPTGSLYTIVETAVTQGSTNVTANYKVTYSTQTGVSSGAITVTNQYLYALPSTGGPGVRGMYTLGGALLLTAILLTLRRKRVRQRVT